MEMVVLFTTLVVKVGWLSTHTPSLSKHCRRYSHVSKWADWYSPMSPQKWPTRGTHTRETAVVRVVRPISDLVRSWRRNSQGALLYQDFDRLWSHKWIRSITCITLTYMSPVSDQSPGCLQPITYIWLQLLICFFNKTPMTGNNNDSLVARMLEVCLTLP
jgi:hypothetical protein